MNREVLFRGMKWNADLERLPFVYGYLTNYEVIKDKFGNSHVVHADTIGQFTNLTDKNGVKIFEGDYIGWFGNKNKEEFFKYAEDGLLKRVNKYGEFSLSTAEVYNNGNLEVIGNIHDNE